MFNDNFSKWNVSDKMAANEQGLAFGGEFEKRPPVTAARLLLKINIKNQCLAMLVKPEPKPLCCYCRLIQPQAALAQNPLLAVVVSVGLTKYLDKL